MKIVLDSFLHNKFVIPFFNKKIQLIKKDFTILIKKLNLIRYITNSVFK